ncbi:uncharacterized protein LOC120092055 isoform X4 [Benincasa hispida]|uniref:uncharacterized protein LOC120092055 isoform X4 n=1 Tax=Benincasa hispida TaxID=102211 RepID=UPI0019010DD3|nr:uncharacterized protein LOC120092055 isoform X4 [Benincasa hispida]
MQDNNPFFCPFSASQQELVATDCLWFMRSSQIEFSLYVLILHPEPYSQVNGKWQIGKQATCADEITFIPPSTTKLNISPVTEYQDPRTSWIQCHLTETAKATQIQGEVELTVDLHFLSTSIPFSLFLV